MKENIDERHKKFWRRSEKQEEHVNEEQVQGIMLTGFEAIQDHDESTRKEEDVRIQEVDEDEYVIIQEENGKNVRTQKNDESTDEEEYDSAS